MVGRKVCSYCRAEIGLVEVAGGGVTHGVCDLCKPRVRAEIELYRHTQGAHTSLNVVETCARCQELLAALEATLPEAV
jgi:hypothetical protein